MLIDGLRRKVETGLAVLLIAAAEGKVQLVAGLSRSDRADFVPGNWLKEVGPDRRRRRRRPARPGPGRRQVTEKNPRRSGTGDEIKRAIDA